MELAFEQQTIAYLQRIFSRTAAQEQTQELIVPDSYPDCSRIVFTGASAIVRGKECRDGSVVITGGVRAGLLYIPEDDTRPRALECYLPFSVRVDEPAATAQMDLRACCHVRSADARLINSRKILVRTNLVCELEGYAAAEQTLCTVTQAPDTLQRKTANYRLMLPQEYAEKTFSMNEELDVPASEPEMEQIVHYWLTPEVTEKKLTGTRAVFKGNLVLKALYLTPDGEPAVFFRQIPFAQYCELRESYEDEEFELCLCMTGSELELEKQEESGTKLLLSASVLCQCLTLRAHEITLTEDAYTTKGIFTPQWSTWNLTCRLDRQNMLGTLRGSVPKQARAVIDSTLYLDAPAQQRQDAAVQLSVPATVNILYYDVDGALQSAIVHDQASCTVPAGSGAACEAKVSAGRDGFAAPSGGGIDVRYDVNFEIACCCEQSLTTLCGGTIEEEEKQAGEKFCVVVKTNPKTQSLWDLAKQYRTSAEAIAQANQLTGDEAEQGELLLIPM